MTISKAVQLNSIALWLGGCYAAAGPTVGVDLVTGRPTLGLEASAATFTVAQSFAMGSARTRPAVSAPSGGAAPAIADGRNWRSRTYLLWEPGVPLGVRETSRSFGWVAPGATVGLDLEHYDGASMTAHFSAGAWLGVAHTLDSQSRTGCDSDDLRAYVGLVIGIRSRELYAGPKFGVLDIPNFCFSLSAE